MPPDTSTLISADATREILLIHTVIAGMGISISVDLLRKLLSLRRSGESLPGLLLMIWFMLFTELLRAVWLGFLWFSQPAPVLLDLFSFLTAFIVLVGVPITVSARYLPKQDASTTTPKPWMWLQLAMILTAMIGFGVLLGAVGLRLRTGILLGPAAAYALTAVFLLSRVFFYRHLQVRRRPLLLFVVFMVTGLLTLASVAVFSVVAHVRVRQSLALASLNGVGLISVLCAIIFLFANVRLADVIVKRSMRVVVWTCVSLLCWAAVMHSRAIGMVGRIQQDVVCLLLVCNVIVFAPWAERKLNDWIDTWVFEQPDLQSAVATLWARLVVIENREEAFHSTETFLQHSLSLAAVRVKSVETANAPAGFPAFGTNPRTASNTNRIPDSSSHIIPLFVDGQVHHVIQLSQGSARPPLTLWEVSFVERIASRLQIWLSIRAAAERAHREASLQEELTSAELRALRAQVNPHFLFNSLNTIADLTVIAPERAEEMTVRLSSVFRYVLVNTDRQFTSLKEELEFARSYLHIEQTRFGDRLKVDFQIDPSTLNQQVPTLLLQPLIENALKHGLAPRRGGGTLTIRSCKDQESVYVSVADDGVGLQQRTSRSERSTSVGVDNVVNRLMTAYGNRASFVLKTREQGGTEALIRMPRGEEQ